MQNRVAVLLDFDGVVLKKSPLLKTVIHRCNRYVQKHLGIKNPAMVEEVNRQLYESCGHTVLGLNRMGVPASVAEFNKHVYDFIELPTVPWDASEVEQLYKACMDMDASLHIFSNAPDGWVKPLLRAAGSPVLMEIPTLSCVTNTLLKPQGPAYDAVEDIVRADRYVFVDDKLINLLPVCKRPSWSPVLFSNSPLVARTTLVGKNGLVVNSLAAVSSVVQGAAEAHFYEPMR